MKRHNLAFSKGRDLAGHKAFCSSEHRSRTISIDIRTFSTRHGKLSVKNGQPKPQFAQSTSVKESKNNKSTNRDFFLSVLGSTATKREARAYLKAFTPPINDSSKANRVAPKGEKAQPAQKHGVNLGAFYGTARAVENSPRFVQKPTETQPSLTQGPLHIALVKIRAPQHMNDEILDGVARTLSQLGKLGLTSAVVVDCDDHLGSIKQGWKDLEIQQVDRIVAAIDLYGNPGARKIDNILGVSEKEIKDVNSAASIQGRVHVIYRKLLMAPLRRGVIPVISTVAYTDDTHRIIPVAADEVVMALTREFAGIRATTLTDQDPKEIAKQLRLLKKQVSLDRLIILDPLGGIPTPARPNGYHVFLNMEQEFPKVKQELLKAQSNVTMSQDINASSSSHKISDIGRSNPFSQFVEAEFSSGRSPSGASASTESVYEQTPNNLIHLQNLELVRKVLALLPPTTSALLTTPDEASNLGRMPDTVSGDPGVGTRRQRNPLIHNLLTDKPVFSSSLPASRLVNVTTEGPSSNNSGPARISPTTFAKRGMSVSIFPDPLLSPWEPPIKGIPQVKLTDANIDLPRLVHLINDSFDRELDVQNYLKRVNDRVAGVIVAGEYEGGAILTWETPPGVVDDGSEESRSRMVPYLDKFAVLKRSQGSGGVADVVFKAMVRDCFPEGVCWRSRRDNPVNKWYFERSRGTWKMPGTNWTMFWTTPDLDCNPQIFSDYEKVCETIQPTWADNKVVVD